MPKRQGVNFGVSFIQSICFIVASLKPVFILTTFFMHLTLAHPDLTASSSDRFFPNFDVITPCRYVPNKLKSHHTTPVFVYKPHSLGDRFFSNKCN